MREISHSSLYVTSIMGSPAATCVHTPILYFSYIIHSCFFCISSYREMSEAAQQSAAQSEYNPRVNPRYELALPQSCLIAICMLHTHKGWSLLLTNHFSGVARPHGAPSLPFWKIPLLLIIQYILTVVASVTTWSMVVPAPCINYYFVCRNLNQN